MPQSLVPKTARLDWWELFLFATNWFVLQIMLEWVCLQFFPATITQLFTQSFSSYTLRSYLEIFSSTNKLCNFWRSQFQQVSTHALCSWGVIIPQKWNCGSAKNLCKCTESPSTLSTNTSTEWNLYVSLSNHLVTSFRLELNVRRFFEHQKRTSVTDRYTGYFFTARVSRVSVETTKRILSCSLNFRLKKVS